MPEYRPGLPDESVNYSRRSPLLQLAQLLGGMLLIIILLYWLAGLAVGLVASLAPETTESVLSALADVTLPSMAVDRDSPEQQRLEGLLHGLLSALPEGGDQAGYTVEILETPEVNALAMPGHRIVFFQGLLDEVQDDDQLLFIMAHELGHFRHGDHIRRLGRGVVAVLLSVLLTGQDSGITSVAGSLLSGVESGYSQQQELAADRFGVELLHEAGLPANGAVDFLQHIADTDKMHRVLYYFASHPSPEERIEALRNVAR